MDKKKLLLVAVSVGAFLIIVIVAAYIVVQPKGNSTPSAGSVEGNLGYENASAQNVPVTNTIIPPSTGGENVASQQGSMDLTDPLLPVQGVAAEQPALVDPTGMVRNPDGIRSLQEPPVKSTTAGDKRTEQDSTISIASPTRAGVPEAPPVGKAASRQAPESSSSSVAPVQPPPPAAAKSTPIPVAMADPKPRDYFWVQVGSFIQQSRAEDLRKYLDSRGMKSIIEPSKESGATYFRVRIGPYISKEEADSYWLPLIKEMGFEDSLVWQTTIR